MVTARSLLRAELETSSLRRRASVFFSLRDRLNSPLQALMLRLATDDLDGHSSPTLERASSAVNELAALSSELVRLQEELPPHTYPASLDAERELERRGSGGVRDRLS